MDRQQLAAMVAEGLSLAEIGRRLGCHESTVAAWLRREGLEPVHAERHRARGPLSQSELEVLVARGATIAEIATAVERSKTTVRHWLRRDGLRTTNTRGRRRSPVSAEGFVEGARDVVMDCPRHGETAYVRDGRGYYRCRRCRAEAVTRRRRRVKEVLVSEAGGACCICGYNANMRALEFHHVDPSTKRFELNARGVALGLERLRAEARKCVLLCSNCHAEVEDGRLVIEDPMAG